MPSLIVWVFLAIGTVFAAVHNLAVTTSLYWYYGWFDIVMHLWGGMLVVLGVYALCSLKHIPLKPTAVLVFGVLGFVMVTWEVFERSVGLYNPSTYLFDVSKDILMGLIGGLLGYLAAVKLRM